MVARSSLMPQRSFRLRYELVSENYCSGSFSVVFVDMHYVFLPVLREVPIFCNHRVVMIARDINISIG